MMHDVVNTKDAPQAIGPYSQAIKTNNGSMLFVSGQIPLDPHTMEVCSTDVKEQTIMVLKNLRAVLQEAGHSVNNVAKTTVYIKDMNDFAVINEEYSKVFSEHKPARACVEVARLPKDVLVEIDAVSVA
jgi:2-iminobutanoate/2-iminopropanoate deaminase